MEGEKKQKENSIKSNRRGRPTKIRTSCTGSKENISDIIKKNNDLVDKKLNPSNKVYDDEEVLQDGTLKSCLVNSSLEHNLIKEYGNVIEKSDSKSKDINTIKDILRKNEADKNLLNKQIMDLNDSFDSSKHFNNKNISSTEIHNNIDSQREESNAFKVLMKRSKPIQYKSSVQQLVENAENNEKSTDTKELKLKHKEKLIALADKKGYSKRKFIEAEEDERIEKNIKNRIKLFKNDNENNDNVELSIKNNKQLSGNLLDYFSKSPSELINKNGIQCMSSFIVKADVHRTDTSDIKPVLETLSNKIYSNKKLSSITSKMDLSNLEDIHVIASEDIILPQTAKEDNRKKSRWSLRIKLRNDDTCSDITDDELLLPRNKSKFSADANKPRKRIISEHVDDNKICLKNYNVNVEAKIRDKQKNQSFDNLKDSKVQTDVINEKNVNNKSSNMCLKKSSETSRIKEELNDTNETIITVTDDSECKINNENVFRRKSNIKLAPLFTKRRKTDPNVAAARRLFLQSDIINVENKNVERKMNNNGVVALPFPTISHVTQLENESNSIKLEIKYKFPMKVEKKYLPLIDVSKYKSITSYNGALKTTKINDKVNEPVKENWKEVLPEIEKYCPDAQKMWEIVSKIKSESEKKSSRMKSSKKKSLERKGKLTENIKSEEENQLHDCMWTCKYKPTNAQEVVGNEEAAGKLKDWLSGWSTSLTTEDDYSSSEEFYSSDCSTSYKSENNQVAVLLGPHGSGKSASVYAIAEELDYSVLEVNASSKRTGKKIFKELEEATKSHRIKKNKHRSLFEESAKKSETTKVSQNSLILLEDVDLIFEEDEGFISAAYQLASNTKRPIVMSCRDTCPHLIKMAPQQNKIYFQRVNGSRVSALLELISLAETGYRLPHSFLMKLLQAGDLRKALLQLQYLLLSGPPVLSQQSTVVKSSLWQDMQHYLYKPAIKLNKMHQTKKGTDIKKSKKRVDDIACILNSLADNLDNLSLVSSLIDIEDIALSESEVNACPSLSLAENPSLYSTSRYLNADIASFISDKILYKDFKEYDNIQNESHIILRKQLNQGVDVALSHITSAFCDRRIMATDYLPTARAICRAEESRSIINQKRGNRFFHYLQNLNVPTVSIKPNILAAACRTLQERENKDSSSVVNTSN